MRAYRSMIAAGVALAAWAGAGAAAQPIDPDWPCVQRKVPELSVGQMWQGRIPEQAADAEVRALAQRLALRRVPLDAIGAEAAAATDGLPREARAEWLGALFAAILGHINAERGAVIAGIGRYAHHQAELAERIETRQLELAELREAPDDARDMDRIEELDDTLAWDTRIFKERAQSLAYVCETPVILEQRAFAIARELAELL